MSKARIRKEDESHSASHCTEPQFSTFYIVPKGQMDGKKEEVWEGKLALICASLSHHSHLVLMTGFTSLDTVLKKVL